MFGISSDKRTIDQDVSALPLDSDSLFSNHKNIYNKGVEKRQRKLIEKIPFLRPFLNEGEKILLVTTGCSPMSFLEQFFGGWVVYALKRSLFVFTNRRIFHIPTKSDYAYRNTLAQILYGDCQIIQMKGRTLVVQYKSGKKEKFYYIARREKKKLVTLLAAVAPGGAQSKAQRRTHLCPRCATDLVEAEYLCPGCRLEFKTKAEGKRISIIYPGGGYFYTRHWWLGISDAITEALLLVLVVSALVNALRGTEGGFGVFVVLLIFLVIEKAVSVYHSNHFIEEYIPMQKEIKPMIAGR